MSYRPADEGYCGAAAWGDADLSCVPGPTDVVTVAGRFVALAFCLRCDELVAREARPSAGTWVDA